MNFLHDYAEKHLGMVAAVILTSSVLPPTPISFDLYQSQYFKVNNKDLQWSVLQTPVNILGNVWLFTYAVSVCGGYILQEQLRGS